MSLEPSPIGRLSATGGVYDALRQAILQHRFLPGERLNIGEIAGMLGVSLTPVRHAVQHLAAEGLIEIRPRHGTFVSSLSTEETAEAFDIRRALECLAAETAVSRISSEQVARLKQWLAVLRRTVHNDQDLRKHEAANAEFHRILVEACGNRRLVALYDALKVHAQIRRVHFTGSAGLRLRLVAEQAEHEEILAALMARDRDRLAAAVARHVERAKSALIATRPSPLP